MIDSWISNIEYIHGHLIVGLDVEWRPSFNRYVENPVATLQLCIGCRCLVVQLIYAPFIPQSLSSFLTNTNYTFVGVGIESDVEKLLKDYGLAVSDAVDLRGLAANKLDNRELRNAGLRGLAREVLQKDIEKPRSITISRWDNEWLTRSQVQYACIDAFLSFEIGKSLNTSG